MKSPKRPTPSSSRRCKETEARVSSEGRRVGPAAANFAGHQRILLVDDDPGVLRSISDVLACEGYRAEQVDNAASALGLLARQRFQLVVLDSSAPSTGGWDTVEKLVLLHPDLPVIVLASGEGTSRSRAMGGASEIIPKPINFPALRKALKRALTPPAETWVVQCFDGGSPGARPAVGPGVEATRGHWC
jgi:CheY-like chemotaxis protein